MRQHRRRLRFEDCETLETRTVLSAAGMGSYVVGTMVEGTVANAQTQAGVAGVPIQLINLNGQVVRQSRTDSLGHFQFTRLRSASYVVREAGQTPSLPDHTFLNGVPIDVGRVDLVTGGAFPAVSLAYPSNASVLTADAPGRAVFEPLGSLITYPQSPAAVDFEAREAAIKQFARSGDGLPVSNFVGPIVHGGLLGFEGLTVLLHLI